MVKENKAFNFINVNKYAGPSFLSLLTIVFVIAKILGKITWSWWIVFLPIWGPIVVVLLILTLCIIFAGFYYIFKIRKK